MDGLVRFRAGQSDAARWKAAAEACGLTLSEWLRLLANHAAARRADPAAVAAELTKIRRDLNAGIGNNLNQTAEHANRLARAGELPDAEALAKAVETARAALTALKADIAAVLAGASP